LKFRHAMEALRGLWRLGNSYIAQQEPWKLIVDQPKAALSVLAHCLHLIRLYAVTMQPIMPERADFILDLLGIKDDHKWHLKPATLVFTKIPQKTVDELTQRFSGQ
ncbi:MAG: hypothetical protein AAB323_01955, partial [Pseudomonadota bacterium]